MGDQQDGVSVTSDGAETSKSDTTYFFRRNEG